MCVERGQMYFGIQIFFEFWEGNTAHVLGLGQHPLIKHITISAAKCMNIHIKWGI